MSQIELIPEKKEDGSLKLYSKRFGVGLTVAEAGSFTDQRSGEVKHYDEFIKITAGDFSLKLNPLAALWLVGAFSAPEMMAKIQERANRERAELMAAADALVY